MDGLEHGLGFHGRGPTPEQMGLPRNLDRQVRTWMAEQTRAIERVTGVSARPERRVETVSTRQLRDHLVAVSDQQMRRVMGPVHNPVVTLISKAITSYMAPRVLGLYVPRWQSPSSSGMYVVPEAIARVSARTGVKAVDLAQYVTCHEATHQWQSSAHPWFDAHMSRSIDHLMSSRAMQKSLAKGLVDRAVIDEVRKEAAQIQATMSLVEGHADFMAEQLAPAHIRAVGPALEKARMEQPRSFVSQLLDRILSAGKARQYTEGVKFCRAVHAAGGHALLNRVWEQAENLPTPAEIANPSLWVARIRGWSGSVAA